jgi:hypothetical protein
MRFKNLRHLEDEILNKILKLVPVHLDINVGSNIHYLAEDMALLLTEVQSELEALRYKYKIEDNDLLPLTTVLSRGESIPARTVLRALGEKV